MQHLADKTLVVIFNYSKITQDSFFLGTLPTTIWQEANQYPTHRKRKFLASRWLLAYLMQQVYHCESLPDILSLPNHPPCFKDPSLPKFNISYSEPYVAIILARPHHSMGIDIETERFFPKSLALAQHFFTHEEHTFLEQFTDEVTRQYYFWRLWTLKEALIKLHGLSVTNIRDIQLSPNNNLILNPYGYAISFQTKKNIIGAITSTYPLQSYLAIELILEDDSFHFVPITLDNKIINTPSIYS